MPDLVKNTFLKKKDESPLNSPFKVREKMVFRRSAAKGAGRNGAEAMYRNGLITSRQMTVLRMLDEFGVLTSRMAADAMDFPLIEGRLKKAHNTKSPYKNDLSRLLRMGLIAEGTIYIEEKERMKVYYLTRGVSEWAREKFRYDDKLFETGTPRSFSAVMTVPELMRRLSANKFAIKAMNSAYKDLAERRIGYFKGLAFFELFFCDQDDNRLYIVSLRKLRFEKLRAAAAMEEALKDKSASIIFLTTDISSARKLHKHLVESDHYDDERVYYCDDFEVEESTGFPCLYRFTENGYLRYELYR